MEKNKELLNNYLMHNIVVKVKDDTHLCAKFKDNTYMFEFNVAEMLDRNAGIIAENDIDVERELKKLYGEKITDEFKLKRFVIDYIYYRKIAYKDVFEKVEAMFHTCNKTYDRKLNKSVAIENVENTIKELIESYINNILYYWLRNEYVCAVYDEHLEIY